MSLNSKRVPGGPEDELKSAFLAKYPMSDTDLRKNLLYTSKRMRELQDNAIGANDMGYDYADPLLDWALEEFKLNSHLQNVQNYREGRVI